MKEYWVDFSGYLIVKADSVGEVETKVWRFINNINLPDGMNDDVWDIDGIEEKQAGE